MAKVEKQKTVYFLSFLKMNLNGLVSNINKGSLFVSQDHFEFHPVNVYAGRLWLMQSWAIKIFKLKKDNHNARETSVISARTRRDRLQANLIDYFAWRTIR